MARDEKMRGAKTQPPQWERLKAQGEGHKEKYCKKTYSLFKLCTLSLAPCTPSAGKAIRFWPGPEDQVC
jgi:hypothetical protein